MTADRSVAIIQGDPAGIGPELMVKLLMAREEKQGSLADAPDVNVLLIGDPRVHQSGCDVVGQSPHVRHINHVSEADYSDNTVNHLDITIDGIDEITPAQASATCLLYTSPSPRDS